MYLCRYESRDAGTLLSVRTWSLRWRTGHNGFEQFAQSVPGGLPSACSSSTTQRPLVIIQASLHEETPRTVHASAGA